MRRSRSALVCLALLLGGPTPVAASAAPIPNDPLFEHCPQPGCVDEQWNLRSDGRGISADRAWKRTRGEGVVVASIDSGLDFAHPDLAGRIWTNPGETGRDSAGEDRRSNGVDDDGNGYVDDWRGWDFYEDDNDPTDDTAFGHGTGTAGIAVAEQGNAIGISGVAPEARLMVLRPSDTFIVTPTRLAQAIRYAADNGADVVTMSLGSVGTNRLLREAVSYAESRGVVLVAAMGNEFSLHPNSPAWLDPVIGVGAIVPDTGGTGAPTATDFTVKAGYSNYGPGIDVVAPSSVFTTRLGGGFGKGGGTSSATPHAAGTAALVLARARGLGLDLSAAEVTQIIRQSADDLVGGPYRYRKGWDRWTGWGRVNAARAVRMVGAARIPPVADIDAPEWYAAVTDGVTVRGTVSGRSAPFRYDLLVGEGGDPRTFELLASGTRARPFTGRLGVFDPRGRPPGQHTLLLRVTDARGNVGEDRQAFTLVGDRDLAPGFPRDLGASGESPPLLADLDGVPGDELIVATADGLVHAFRPDGTELTGWPVAQDEAELAGSAVRSGFLASPAVADLMGPGRRAVVIAGLDGKVYAWDAGGRAVPGWPVPTKVPPGPDPTNPVLESTVFSSPAVADLDGNATNGPEVVVGGGDGRVHAFHADGGTVDGWPVLLHDPADPGTRPAKIASSPAVGDIDGDGQSEVIIGSGEGRGATVRVFALRGDGTLQPGWPARLPALTASGIPLVGTGVPQSPALADTDGDADLEVAIAGFTTFFHLLEGDGSEVPGGARSEHFFSAVRGPASDSDALTYRSTVANLAVGDLDRDGVPDLVGGATDFRIAGAALFEGRRLSFDHLVAAWDGSSGDPFAPFPRVVEDWMFLTAPALVDVDGDRRSEVVVGNGAGFLHAFRVDGSEPPGWPKFVGQWAQSSPAAGDFDADGRVDVAFVTRQGWLYVFKTEGRAGALDWPSMRGTPEGTGVFEVG